MNLQALTAAISAVAPIDGVSADGTMWFKSNATGAQRAAALAVFTNWVDPPPPVILTFFEFMSLFNSTEQAAIVNSTDPQVKLFTLHATGAGSINLSDPVVKQGLDYLVSLGIITSARETAILANQNP